MNYDRRHIESIKPKRNEKHHPYIGYCILLAYAALALGIVYYL